MYAPVLFILVGASSFYGTGAEDDKTATRALIKPFPEELQILEPKFLTETSEEARQQFAAIITDKSLTIAEIDDKLSKWAAEQGGQIQSQFEDAKKKLQSMFAKEKEAIANSSLSDAAKEAFAKIGEIAADGNQTAQHWAQQKEAIVDSLSKDVRDEMKEFMISAVGNVFNKMQS